jgi:hypothetical protein
MEYNNVHNLIHLSDVKKVPRSARSDAFRPVRLTRSATMPRTVIYLTTKVIVGFSLSSFLRCICLAILNRRLPFIRTDGQLLLFKFLT